MLLLLLLLHSGCIQESLKLFQQATALNPHKIANLKQVMVPHQH
jgi:Bardet-Biedl syndrome 4 protein